MLLIERANLPLERAHGVDGLVDLVEQPLALQARVLQFAHDARNKHLLARNQPAQSCDAPSRSVLLCGCGQLLFKLQRSSSGA